MTTNMVWSGESLPVIAHNMSLIETICERATRQIPKNGLGDDPWVRSVVATDQEWGTVVALVQSWMGPEMGPQFLALVQDFPTEDENRRLYMWRYETETTPEEQAAIAEIMDSYGLGHGVASLARETGLL